jgi:hypothetical protein
MLWIVCACFFDVQSFKKLRLEARQKIHAAFPELKASFLVLDDSAGTDPEMAELAQFEDCTIMTLPYNMGHQAALVYGLRRLGDRISETDFVLTLDSDGEDRPEDIPSMLMPLWNEKDRLPLVSLAWRTQRKESLGFKLGYFFFRIVFRILTGEVIQNGNFAAYRGWLLKEVIHHPHFDQCYASSFISLPLQLHFVPLARGTRFFGKSKMSRSALLTHGLRMLMPFTEKIATRGVVASIALTALSVVAFAFALIESHSVLLASLAFLCAIAFALVSGQFVLLFATFSQSKAAKLTTKL